MISSRETGAALEPERGEALARARQAMVEAYRTPEECCVPPLIEAARLGTAIAADTADLAGRLVLRLRKERARAFGVEALMKEFSLSSREGVALMCLAESLLRIPDVATRDLLIRDKLAGGDWHAHLGASPSWFVNASTWGLFITGKLVATSSQRRMASALARAVAKGGEPIIRKAIDLAMRLLGRQFVTGQTIEEALERAKPFEARGFLYSFDMLGEAALTEEDASKYLAAYEHAIEAIGAANRGKGVYGGAGISVKLSALHPRYSYAQMDRVREELYPRLRRLAVLASKQDIGLNIDAEEADRLEPSLDLLEMLAAEKALGNWQGLGFVVQAYQKRAPFLIDYLIELAAQSRRRLMIRLVKGAYWDNEIKRAQIDGLSGYPVFTRKTYTDVSYLACAKRLLARRDLVFPQFATHNAYTLSAVYHLAGNFQFGDYEFQCLHGMGEPLYSHVIGENNLNRPCRIYAPVGTHKTLLPYLVRRLLENGANSSFVHQLVDEKVPIEDLIAGPVEEAARYQGTPHSRIALPAEIFDGERKNSKGIDLSDRRICGRLQEAIVQSRSRQFAAAPTLSGAPSIAVRAVPNPANAADIVGHAADAEASDVDAAMAAASQAATEWSAVKADERAAILDRAAGIIEDRIDVLCALLVREAGKTLPNAVSEVREAVDFCRYYAAQARRDLKGRHLPLGPIVSISPWNFPLAIFTGQIAAALAAGNPVLAKPAEQTPLIAAQAVRILHEAGIPHRVLQLLPGAGEIGAALVADPRTKAVLFTGSTEVARSIQQTLAHRGDIPLIAETGGQNAMIVDSSALPEQVVTDVLTSAFDSAGQRCSALRVLCLQEEIADDLIYALKGAMAELRIGDPSLLSTDVGPVIDAEAESGLKSYLAAQSHRILFQMAVPDACAAGNFVPPALIGINSLGKLTREVFGPILHIRRFDKSRLNELIAEINGTGYGLTLGIHSRIDETIDTIAAASRAGNIYVNRNMIGAVVGVQPFGGEGLSGTGPKAGGPLYLQRLLSEGPRVALNGIRDEQKLEALVSLAAWVESQAKGLISEDERIRLGELFKLYREISLLPVEVQLPGPVGEENRLRFEPRGTFVGIADTPFEALHEFGATLATGNRLLLTMSGSKPIGRDSLPDALRHRIEFTSKWETDELDGVLLTNEAKLAAVLQTLANRDGPIIPAILANPAFDLARLVKEKTVSVNTAAAGGNASLVALVA